MNYIDRIKNEITHKYLDQKEFIQATNEILDSLSLVINSDHRYEEHKLLERLIEPERLLSFDVKWMDDNRNIQTNKGYRVQFNSVLGPYKGGLRFHPSVNVSVFALQELGTQAWTDHQQMRQQYGQHFRNAEEVSVLSFPRLL